MPFDVENTLVEAAKLFEQGGRHVEIFSPATRAAVPCLAICALVILRVDDLNPLIAISSVVIPVASKGNGDDRTAVLVLETTVAGIASLVVECSPSPVVDTLVEFVGRSVSGWYGRRVGREHCEEEGDDE